MTILKPSIGYFCSKPNCARLKELKVIAFTHKTTDISNIGKLHIQEENRKERLEYLKEIGISELLYISTCNRVEFVFVAEDEVNNSYLEKFFAQFNPKWNQEDVAWAIDNCVKFEGIQAVRHLFHIASSLDSLVIGEREIITQVRKSFDECNQLGLTGDVIRLLISKTIESAKEVYTKTNIAKNPVSIVSLAYRTLKELNLNFDSRVLIVGAGETNTNMCKFLFKHGFTNFTVVNRTFEKGQALADQIEGQALALSDLESHKGGFDLLVTCTGSEDPIFTKQVYDTVLQGDKSRKVIIDLAIPNDVHYEVIDEYSIHYIEIKALKEVSQRNLHEREKELSKCNALIEEHLDAFKTAFKERQVEIAMREVPQKVKEIKDLAINEVFAKEVESMDEASKEVLDKMLNYIEKKYISVPMKMAREIIVNGGNKR